MGFLGNLISGAVKVAVTPIAILKDSLDVFQGEEPVTTKKVLKSAAKDINKAAKNL